MIFMVNLYKKKRKNKVKVALFVLLSESHKVLIALEANEMTQKGPFFVDIRRKNLQLYQLP